MSELTTESLANALMRLHVETDDALRTDHNRSLSFQDGFFDRWERARRLGFGTETQVYNSAQVFGDVSVGSHTFIGAFCVLDGGYAPVRIGDYVSVSAGVHIYSHDTVLWSLSGGIAEKRVGPVTIEDCCYLGSQCVIACGVHIGRQSVVAANSMVNKDVPARTVVGGSPARLIGRVEGEGDTVRVVYSA